MKWTIICFNHPDESKSVLYRQNLTDKGLLKAIESAINKGANLISIRGFDDTPKIAWNVTMEENVPMKIEMIPA